MTECAPTGVIKCEACAVLWKECSDALQEYLRIIAERSAARDREDYDVVEAFEAIESESLERCQNARQAIFNHEVTHIIENVGQNSSKKLATEMLSDENGLVVSVANRSGQ